MSNDIIYFPDLVHQKWVRIANKETIVAVLEQCFKQKKSLRSNQQRGGTGGFLGPSSEAGLEN